MYAADCLLTVLIKWVLNASALKVRSMYFRVLKSTGMTSEEFCEELLNEQKVAVVPGNAFGESGEGFIRVSYAYSLKHLMEALKRIEIFIRNRKLTE